VASAGISPASIDGTAPPEREVLQAVTGGLFTVTLSTVARWAGCTRLRPFVHLAAFRLCLPPPAIDRSLLMSVVSNLQRNLRENITAVMSGLHTRAQLNGFVSACHALALAFLRSKRSVGLLADAEGLKLPDLAYDCIADLFQKSESGDFVRIRAYFGGLDIDRVTDEELLTYLRRLVFSLVNQGVFRLYHEVDPPSAKSSGTSNFR